MLKTQEKAEAALGGAGNYSRQDCKEWNNG